MTFTQSPSLSNNPKIPNYYVGFEISLSDWMNLKGNKFLNRDMSQRRNIDECLIGLALMKIEKGVFKWKWLISRNGSQSNKTLMVWVTCRLLEKDRMERFRQTTRNPQFSVRHKRGTEDTLNPKEDIFEEKKLVMISQNAGINQKPAAGGGGELISWHWWSIHDGDTTILYKTFEKGFILWHWV